MSSHHVVRDEQEPALFIIEPEASNLEFIQQLLEWSPTLVVVEQALDQVLQWGIKIDVVVCQETSFENIRTQTTNQYPIEIIAVNDNLVEHGLKYLYHRNHASVNIITQFDQDLVKRDFLEKMDVIVFSHEFKAFYVAQGAWKKWVTADTLFKVLPIATEIPPQTENLIPYVDVAYQPNEQYLKPAHEGFIQVSHPDHPFWVFEKVGA
ncbi:hypothetical protein [uncultured Microscilla sp.]|uniref:hypothetical protein n=1 Tax=uncultured Microscilla sp. TaxID=432653 RepID=UPI00261717FA|nr:hypothetical protein [uncultured Microscilla sp.]